jgi:hypothetical protein
MNTIYNLLNFLYLASVTPESSILALVNPDSSIEPFNIIMLFSSIVPIKIYSNADLNKVVLANFNYDNYIYYFKNNNIFMYNFLENKVHNQDGNSLIPYKPIDRFLIKYNKLIKRE